MYGSSRRNGQQLPGGRSPGDLFRSAAEYYARFRRPYPPPVVSHLVERYGLDGRGRLLDMGCGTGQVFEVLARWFEETVALDADAEMVHHARRRASELGLANVRVLPPMRAEDVDGSLGPFRMAVFGQSFHWMDRRLVAERVYDLLAPDGHLVVLAAGGFHTGTTPWEAEIVRALEKWLGPERGAGGGVYHQGERHEQALDKTRFRNVTITDINVQESWSIDELVGLLFSTSYASRAVLGDNAAGFEQELRSADRDSARPSFRKDGRVQRHRRQLLLDVRGRFGGRRAAGVSRQCDQSRDQRLARGGRAGLLGRPVH